MDELLVHTQLCKLGDGEWARLLLVLQADRSMLGGTSRSEQAVDLIRWFDRRGRGDDLQRALTPSSSPSSSLAAWQAHQLAKARELRVIGFREKSTPFLDIHRVFVPLSLQRGGDRMQQGDTDIWSALGSLPYSQRGLVIVGLPGSGKSTLLQHVYSQVAEHHLAQVDRVPVLLPARLVPTGFKGNARDLPLLIERVATAQGYEGAGRQLCGDNPRLLVLVDGLDEIGHDQTRSDFAAWLSQETTHWPDCQFVLTCRPPAFERDRRALTERLRHLTVCPFDDPAITAYVEGWWAAVQEVEGHRIFTTAVAQERAAELLAQLIGGGASLPAIRLLQLAANPLTLSLLCLVDLRSRGRLPKTRSALYDECLGVLLEGRPHDRGRPLVDRDQGRLLLGPLTWQMQQAAGVEPQQPGQAPIPMALPRAQVVAALAQCAKELEDPPRATAEQLATWLDEECDLLCRPDHDELSFTHLTFQEHLAALYAQRCGLSAELIAVAHLPTWHEVLRLCARFPDLGEPLLRGMLGRPELDADLVRGVAAELERRPSALLRELAETTPLAAELLGEGRPDGPVVTGDWEPTTTPLERPEDLVGWALRRRVLQVLDLSLVWVPPGVFWMGATKERGHPVFDDEAQDREGPPRRVRIRRGFWLGEHPVTNNQWRAFCDATKRDLPPTWRVEAFAGRTLPVTGVSWDDSQGFCAWLQPQLGPAVARLPTEAEWEWAARSTNERRYPWGTLAPDASRAVFGDSSLQPIGGRPTGVGPFGNQDQAGQVWEWVQDNWRNTHPLVTADDVDPCFHTDNSAAARALRGGSWFLRPKYLRCASRSGDDPGARTRNIGFRLCVSVPPSTTTS